jgi:ATP-binding cassette subfamily C (CFTR/MRP) protein 4
LGTIILVGILNPWSFISAVLAAIGMLFLRHRFAPCSRDLKRLVGTTRSPIYSQLSSIINGLKVIRSYHAENICSNEFFHHLDNNTRVNYLISTLNRWSAMRFDWISLIFIMIVIILAVIARTTNHGFSTVEIALTLTYSLSLMGLFQWTIRLDRANEVECLPFQRKNVFILDYQWKLKHK